MDNFGDLFGGLGEMLGGLLGGDEGAEGLGALLRPEGRGGESPALIVYERYLCGGPREIGINDR